MSIAIRMGTASENYDIIEQSKSPRNARLLGKKLDRNKHLKLSQILDL